MQNYKEMLKMRDANTMRHKMDKNTYQQLQNATKQLPKHAKCAQMQYRYKGMPILLTLH